MWNTKTVSVVFSTYRERASIRKEIEDFFATGVVDEIVVVNNNAEPGTDDAAPGTEPPAAGAAPGTCGTERSDGKLCITPESTAGPLVPLWLT